MPTSTAAGSGVDKPTVERPLSWSLVGSFVDAGREFEVTTFPLGFGELCVGARSRGVALVDSCGVADAWYVTLVDADLYVTGTRVHAGDVAVHTTAGDHAVPAFPANGIYAFFARVAADEDVIGIDDGPRTAGCPYRRVLNALIASQAIGVPHVPARIKVCTSNGARVDLGGSSASLQGAAAVLRRVGDGFSLLSVGSEVCEPHDVTMTSRQAAQQADTMAACDSLADQPT